MPWFSLAVEGGQTRKHCFLAMLVFKSSNVIITNIYAGLQYFRETSWLIIPIYTLQIKIATLMDTISTHAYMQCVKVIRLRAEDAVFEKP